jgi:hypothetical protein
VSGSQRLTTLQKEISCLETRQFIDVSDDLQKNQQLLESGRGSEKLLSSDEIAII